MGYREYFQRLKSKNVSARDIGTALACAVARHRDNSREYYCFSTRQHFANQENEWMLDALAGLLKTQTDVAADDIELFIPSDSIYVVNFVCDVVQFYFRNTPESDELPVFLADTARAAVFSGDFNPDQRGIELHEYYEILGSCRHNLEKQFRTRLQKPYYRPELR